MKKEKNNLVGLASLFYSLAIANMSLEIATQSLQEDLNCGLI